MVSIHPHRIQHLKHADLSSLLALLVNTRLVLADVLGLLQHVPLVLLGVEVLEAEPEGNTTGESNAGNGGVVPDQVRVLRDGGESLANGGRDGAHEQVHGHDERLHVLGSLGVGVLVRGDVGKDLGKTNQDVGERLSPDVDGSRAAVLLNTIDDLLATGVVTAGAHLVDVVLHDSGGNHGQGSEHETESHTLDGSEGNADLAQQRVQNVINDGNHDDDGDGVQVLNDVVGDTVTLKSSSLHGQVAGHLVVGQEEDGQEEEDLAGHQTTADLINPGVIVGEPRRALGNGNVGGLGGVPVNLEAGGTLAGEEEHLQELGQNGASGRRQLVVLLLRPQDNGGKHEHAGGDDESLPETLKLLNVDHTDLTGHGTNVDTEVEVEEDTGVGDGRVDDDTLALADLNAHAGILVLLSQQGRDVGLEETSTNAETQETDDEGSERRVRLDDDGGGRGGDEDNVGNGRDTNGQVKSPETTHAGIGNPGTRV